jgi:catechol 2,3-dioxygenase-like lactoylglutathione lyase family enzyme
MRLDHVVILVADLAQAKADYEAMGFHVVLGGRHVGTPTHNALVIFGDGTYLELLAPLDAASARRSSDPWLLRLKKGEGLVAYAVRCSPLPTAPPEVAGVAWEAGEEGRARPDGVELRWRMLMPSAGDLLTPLPFFIEDVTPTELRVPPEAAEEHGLPIAGIARLRVAVADVVTTATHLRQLLGVESEAASSPGAVRFILQADQITQVVELVGPDGDSRAADHLARLGEGPYEIELAVVTDAGGGRLLDGPTHGVRFVLGAMSVPRA